MAGQQNPLHKNLFEKVKRGDVDEVVRIVRESGIDVSQVIDEPKNFSQTLAFTACIIRDQELALKMVKVLIELGVDPQKEDTLKQKPIFYAAREGNIALINFLISLGSEDLNRQDKYGQTAVYYAVREGHVATVRHLVDLGANLDISDTKNQRPIYYAI